MDPLTLLVMWWMSSQNKPAAPAQQPVVDLSQLFDLPPFPGKDWIQLPEPLTDDVVARMTALAAQLMEGQHKVEMHPHLGAVMYEHAGAEEPEGVEGPTHVTMRAWILKKPSTPAAHAALKPMAAKKAPAPKKKVLLALKPMQAKPAAAKKAPTLKAMQAKKVTGTEPNPRAIAAIAIPRERRRA